MKTLLIILLTLTIWSCSKDKCESCVRTWKYKTYILTGANGVSSVQNFEGGTENFTACGEDMIEAEEKAQTTYSKTPITGYANKWSVVEGTGTCTCK